MQPSSFPAFVVKVPDVMSLLSYVQNDDVYCHHIIHFHIMCCAEVATLEEDTSRELSVGELLERANRDRSEQSFS